MVQINLANLNLTQGKFETAAMTYQKMLNQIETGPLRAAVQHNLSIALRALGRHTQAKELWELATQSNLQAAEVPLNELQ